MAKSFEEAVRLFGKSASEKLSNPSVKGSPEDQLRNPLDTFFADLAALNGLPAGALQLVGETSLADLKIRPDFAVTLNGALVGFIEVKAPGKGSDPRKYKSGHDKDQWSKLKSLPNVLYTDGNGFSLWQDGELAGRAEFEGDIETVGGKLVAPAKMQALLNEFIDWNPIPPGKPAQLAEITARLCRLLRDEVVEQMDHGNAGLTGLAKDWRKLLFPTASDEQFADGYAQAVTFGLLVARAADIDLLKGIEAAAIELRKSDTLIGTALRLLTEDVANQDALKTSLQTLLRVIGAVDWHKISKDRSEAWLYFYEDFLNVYDKALRRKTGSYYTPPEVVEAMVRLTDEILRGPLFQRHSGFAHQDVTVCDPAVGTGTFLLEIMRRIAASVESDAGLGAGGVSGQLSAAAKRLIGFELQFGPFAVAQLRLIGEFQTLIEKASGKKPETLPDLRLFITDTLGDPFIEEDWIPSTMAPVADSRRRANEIKKNEPIMVVIGNPPYKEKANGMGGWVEGAAKRKIPSPMDWWMPPNNWGVGAHAKHLKNLYVYFWRWATWKVFGSGHKAATGLEPSSQEGIVSFITVAGFLNGPGFQRMRDDLRRQASAIWVIDCSPEGHQPEVATRIFQGVQQPVCIVIAARKKDEDGSKTAEVRFRSLMPGRREEKFKALADLTLDGAGWELCPDDGRAPFLPEAEGDWASFPKLADCFLYDGSGVMPGRTWVVAPDRETLKKRWDALIAEKDAARKEVLFHPQLRKGKVASRHVNKVVTKSLGPLPAPSLSLAKEAGKVGNCVRYAFRSFNRSWVIGDPRLLNDPRPNLWRDYSDHQIYLTGLEASSPGSGPAITFAAHIVDQDHYKGSFGGRVYPLWANAAATAPNIDPDILGPLTASYGRVVGPEDLFTYIAGVMAHSAFTERFRDDLRQPGLRFPLTADAELFDAAVKLGRRIVWLHSYGERFADPEAGRPASPPRKEGGPRFPADGAIPGAPEPLPERMEHDAVKKVLRVGKGRIENVTAEMFAYGVSGMNVLGQWFSYRRRDRTRPIIGDRRPPSPLGDIQPDHWLPEYDTDLINLLHVIALLIDLEPEQADCLERIMAGPLIERDLVAGSVVDEKQGIGGQDGEGAGEDEP